MLNLHISSKVSVIILKCETELYLCLQSYHAIYRRWIKQNYCR